MQGNDMTIKLPCYKRSLKNSSCWLLTLLIVGPLGFGTGCSAMVRTWSFSAAPVDSPQLRVELAEAKVKQKDAYLRLKLHNRSSAPQTIQVGALTMTLPDGHRVTGKTSLVGRVNTGAKNLLSKWGIGSRAPEPRLAPGASMELSLAFRQHRRDLRRHPRLTVDLTGITVDGRPARLAPLMLRQPEGAPVGEQI
jgi:hypothetical protein